MSERFVTRGFVSRRGTQGSTDGDFASHVPPGQYWTTDFPVLSAGSTPSQAARPLVVLGRLSPLAAGGGRSPLP